MRSRHVFAVGLCLAVCATGALAQKERGAKKPAAVRLFAWGLYGAEPALDAIVMLTDEQKEKARAAAAEVLHAPALMELRKKAEDKNAAEADRNAAREQLRAEQPKAQAEMKKRTDEILTADQKALVQKMDEAFKATEADLRKEFQEKLKAAFAAKLDSLLTAEQKDALAKAKAQ